jgi:hypothetical protein
MKTCSRAGCSNRHDSVHPWCPRCRHIHNRNKTQPERVRNVEEEIAYCKQQIIYWTDRLEMSVNSRKK